MCIRDRFKIDCRTADIILEPPGLPVVKNNSLSFITIVGVIELKGLLYGTISLASAPNKPN